MKRFFLIGFNICAVLALCAMIAALILCRVDAAFGWACQYWIPVQGLIVVGFCSFGLATVLIRIFIFKVLPALKALPLVVHFVWYGGVIVAVLLSATGVRHYRSLCDEGSRWVPSVGTVTSVETRRMSDRGWMAWKLHYTYQVDGVDYVGSEISYFDLRLHQCAAVRNMKAKDGRPMKDPVRVFYDPNNPSRSAMMRWVGVPDGVEIALIASLFLFGLYSLYFFWRIIQCLSDRWGVEDRSAVVPCDIGPNFVGMPFALPLLVALAAYLGGMCAYGMLFWNCGDPALGGRMAWFGQYGACLFGTLCATAGSALWPRNVLTIRLRSSQANVWKGAGKKTLDVTSVKLTVVSLALVLLVVVGCMFASLVVDVVAGPDNAVVVQLGLFAALGLSAAFVMGAVGLGLYRFYPSVRHEFAMRGMTLKRFLGRMFAHMSVVALLGFLGYELLCYVVCLMALRGNP